MLLVNKETVEKFACDGCKHNSHSWKQECYECARYFFYKYEDKWAPDKRTLEIIDKFLADNEEGGTKDENQSH